MSESRFSRGATIATVLIGLGALVVSLLGYLATRPDEQQEYAAAVAAVCAKAQSGRVPSDSAMDAEGRWDRDRLVALFDQAVTNNEQWRADLGDVTPPKASAAAHARALTAWTTFDTSLRAYRDSIATADPERLGRGPALPGDTAEVTAASESLRGALAAIGAPERCGFTA